MGTEDTKRIARAFFERFDAGDVAGALAMMSDDATWWLPGKPGALPVRGEHTKAQIARVLETMFGALEHGLAMNVKSMVAEGDRVAVEMTSRGRLKNGRLYEQDYHVALTITDGRITSVREYLDTQHVFATWFAPEPHAGGARSA